MKDAYKADYYFIYKTTGCGEFPGRRICHRIDGEEIMIEELCTAFGEFLRANGFYFKGEIGVIDEV